MATPSRSATVLMSGGLDSTACAHHLSSQGIQVNGIFVSHGQAAASQESIAVSAIGEVLRIPIQKIDLSGIPNSGTGELTGRNALLIFIALFATRERNGLLALGLHAGSPYYDCSSAFVDLTSKLVTEYTNGKVSLLVPFIKWTKKDVYDYFLLSKLPLPLTYSCELGTSPTCGKCASCLDRRALGC